MGLDDILIKSIPAENSTERMRTMVSNNLNREKLLERMSFTLNSKRMIVQITQGKERYQRI